MMRVLAAAFILMSVSGSVFAASDCDEQAAVKPRGYLSELVSLRVDEPHTVPLGDLREYARKQLGVALNQTLPIYLVRGTVPSALRVLSENGWTLGELIPKDEGFHLVYKIHHSSGRSAIAILRVNTHERIVHLQALLKLNGVPDANIFNLGSYSSWKDEFEQSLKSLNEVPDLLVYGFSNSIADSILQMTEEGQKLLPKIREVYLLKNQRLSLETHELANLWLLRVRLKDRRIVWMMPNLYGSMASDLFRAIRSVGPRKMIYLGTSGNITGDRRIGDLFTPAFAVSVNGSRQDLNWLHRVSNVPAQGGYVQVPTYLIETEKWRRDSVVHGATDVEVELGYALSAFRNSTTELSVVLATSDVLVGPNHQAISQQGYSFFSGLVPKFKGIVSHLLFGVNGVPSAAVELTAHPLGHPGEPTRK